MIHDARSTHLQPEQSFQRIKAFGRAICALAIMLSGGSSTGQDCYGDIWFDELLPGNVLGISAATWNQYDVLYIDHVPGAVYTFSGSSSGNCGGPNAFRLTRNSTEILFNGEAWSNPSVTIEGPGHYEAVVYGDGLINDPILSVVVGTVPHIRLYPYFNLSGAWDPSLENMRDDLRALGLIPMAPFRDGWSNEPWPRRTTSPAVLSISGPDAVVDWVTIELRDPATFTVLNKRVGLIKRSGKVTGIDGVSPILFPAPTGEYLIGMRHRNHLGAMTVTPITLTEETIDVDLRDDQIEVFGTQAMMPLGQFRGLLPGNARRSLNAPEFISYVGQGNDRDAILQRIGGTVPTATVSGYHNADVNLDGIVKYTGANNDRDPILQAIGGSTPTAVIFEQLP